jgi:hypothetical protein
MCIQTVKESEREGSCMYGPEVFFSAVCVLLLCYGETIRGRERA